MVLLLLNSPLDQICSKITKDSSLLTELSQLASWSLRLIRISLMKVPDSVCHKFTDHVLPEFPGDFVWTIAFSLNHILYHSMLHFAIKHVFQIVHIILIIIIM